MRMLLHCERVGSTSRSRISQDGDGIVLPAIEMKDLVVKHRSRIASHKQNAERNDARPKIRQIRTECWTRSRGVRSGPLREEAHDMTERTSVQPLKRHSHQPPSLRSPRRSEAAVAQK